MLLTWKRFGDAKEVEEHLLGQFDKEPKEVIARSEGFSGQQHMVILPEKVILQVTNTVAWDLRPVDPKIIRKHLASLYGESGCKSANPIRTALMIPCKCA